MDGGRDDPPEAVVNDPQDGGDSTDPPRRALEDADLEFAPALNEFVAAGRGSALLDAFACNLKQPITEQSWEDVLRAIDLVLEGFGFGLLRELIWAARARSDTARADFTSEGVSPEGQDLLTEILVRHGGGIRHAYAISPLATFPDDWDLVNPEVLLNVSGDELEVATLIRKKNGESINVRSPASGYLRWLVIMHRALLEAGELKRFRERDVEPLLNALDASRAMLAEQIKEQTTESE